MPEPLAHVYDLALRALDEQERHLVELRSRLAPVLAVGGVVATLLIRPALRSQGAALVHVVLVTVGVIGFAVSGLAATYLLMSRRLNYGIRPAYAMEVVQHGGAADAEGLYVTMIQAFDEARLGNVALLRRLDVAFTVMLCGMLVAVCGLAAAAGIA